MWYVNKYLLPVLKTAGVKYDIYNDIHHDGNLESTMKSFLYYGDPDNLYYGQTWHLQDDILFCDHFVDRCAAIDEEWPVVCGTCYILDKHNLHEKILKPREMWWSFPCIRIDDILAFECAQWYFSKARQDPKNSLKVMQKRYDDWFFKTFLEEKYPKMDIYNVYPNLVDHVACLLGGSNIGNDSPQLLGDRRAAGFEDEWLFEDLKESLRKEGRL